MTTRMTSGRRALLLHARDNVATATCALQAGDLVDLEREGALIRIELKDPIPFGHKFALDTIAAGDVVRKYGEVIGTATVPMTPGCHVHIHNVASARGRGDIAP